VRPYVGHGSTCELHAGGCIGETTREQIYVDISAIPEMPIQWRGGEERGPDRSSELKKTRSGESDGEFYVKLEMWA